MKNNHKNKHKKTILAIFLVSVIVSLLMLISLIVLQDKLFIKTIKTLNSDVSSENITNNDINIGKDILLPFAHNFRNDNSNLFIIIGISSIILSMVLSIIISSYVNKHNSKEKEPEYYANEIVMNYLNKDIDTRLIIPENLKNNELINNIIKLKSAIYYNIKDNIDDCKIRELESKILKYQEEINKLENSYNYEKEKNEILFSQIENIKEGIEHNNKRNIEHNEKKIGTLLDKVLNMDKKVENSSTKKINFKIIENQMKKEYPEENNKLKRNNNTLKIYKDNLYKLYKQVKQLCLKNKYKEALDMLLYNLSDNEKRNPKFAYLLGYIYSKLRMNIEAKKYLTIVLSIESRNIEARNLFGVIQYRMGNKRDAEQQFNMVIIMDPNNKIAKENLKKIRSKENKSNKSLENKHSA